ncbi:TonB-dependent receptor plug domain-containing protein [Teredinibacter sp. KSP-S5-2]|uniref:TonB-dependent receptor plug domain-containing protein n=1 Tax=Teredinibacter sp. KSP-S5-2 TaxID=3034506 RepID=UPI0029349CC6|nr:TonB-dependent receptor [Teredinibacter sp. KSP-S5-2]WNO08376.1 TonB-dependent receptor [Teredinibacter sp. KSP-S5-2]
MKKSFISIALISACSPVSICAEEILEEVFVTSSRTAMPLRQVGTSVTVIDAEKIALRGAPQLAEILRAEPGISVSNSGGPGKNTSLSIRGEEGYRTLLLIDGVDVSDPSAPQVSPRIEHMTAGGEIERVEILRGPQGFAYGADAGGVINIITRTGKQEEAGGLFLEKGSYGTTELSGYAALGNDESDMFISVSDFDTKGFNATKNDLTDEEDGYANTTIHSRFGWRLTENTRLQLVARDTETNSEYDNCGSPTQDCTSDFEQTVAKVSVDYQVEQYWLSSGYSYSEVDRVIQTDGNETYATGGSIEKAEVLGGVSLAKNWDVILGGDYETETVTPNGSPERDRNQLGIFSELQTEAAEDFFVTAGARFDDNDDFGQHVSFRLSSAYIFDVSAQSQLKLRASYGTGFRAPSLSEISYNESEGLNSNLSEEQSAGYDLGVDFTHSSGTEISLGYFNQEITDAIEYDFTLGGNSGWGGYGQSEGESTSEGFEMTITYPILQQLAASLNYTYNDALDADGNQRMRKPRHMANMEINWSLEKLTLSANYRVTKDREDRGGVELEDYSVLNLSARYQVNEALSLVARGENILDESYQEVPGYNTLEASVYLGVRYQF